MVLRIRRGAVIQAKYPNTRITTQIHKETLYSLYPTM